MNKEDIIDEIEELSYEAIEAIIDCCKEMHCKGIPLYMWDKEHVESLLDEVIDGWNE